MAKLVPVFEDARGLGLFERPARARGPGLWQWPIIHLASGAQVYQARTYEGGKQCLMRLLAWGRVDWTRPVAEIAGLFTDCELASIADGMTY